MVVRSRIDEIHLLSVQLTMPKGVITHSKDGVDLWYTAREVPRWLAGSDLGARILCEGPSHGVVAS